MDIKWKKNVVMNGTPHISEVPFNYDCTNPPLHIVCTPPQHDRWGKESIDSVSRDFLRNIKRHGAKHDWLMTNGMTYGEYAVWIITNRNEQRGTTGKK